MGETALLLLGGMAGPLLGLKLSELAMFFLLRLPRPLLSDELPGALETGLGVGRVLPAFTRLLHILPQTLSAGFEHLDALDGAEEADRVTRARSGPGVLSSFRLASHQYTKDAP